MYDMRLKLSATDLRCTSLEVPELVRQHTKRRGIMKRMTTSKLIVGLLGLASMTYAWQVKNPPLPEPFHTPAATNGPQVIARPEGVQLSLPKGFSIDVYADGFKRSRFMLAGPSQEILLSDSAENGSVWVLQDKDRDFKGETKKKILEGLDRPFGLALWKDYL